MSGIHQITADGETGILVLPRNSEELAYATVSLLNDDAKSARIGLRATKRAESKLFWHIVARKTQNLHDK